MRKTSFWRRLKELYENRKGTFDFFRSAFINFIGGWKMANSYKVIDEKTWDRAMHCNVFRNSIEPSFCVTFEADITKFKRKVKEQGLSFTLAMVYAVCRCANEIEAFRYRFVDGKVVLFDRIDTAFTYLNKETELFKVVNVPMKDDMTEYCLLAAETAAGQTEYFILILNQPIDKLSAIISSFRVKLPCQATACLRSLSLTELILSVDFVYRTIEN